LDETGAPRGTPVHQESEEAGEAIKKIIKDLVVSSNKQIVETDGSTFFYQTTGLPV